MRRRGNLAAAPLFNTPILSTCNIIQLNNAVQHNNEVTFFNTAKPRALASQSAGFFIYGLEFYEEKIIRQLR